MNCLITERVTTFSLFLLIPVSVFAVKSLYDCLTTFSKEYDEINLFKKRHNCVVMYREKVVLGWPPVERLLKSNVLKQHFEDLFEPLLYFINTAAFSLEVAVMLISVQPILKAFSIANKRGVKIRIILNLEHCKDINLKELVKEGYRSRF